MAPEPERDHPGGEDPVALKAELVRLHSELARAEAALAASRERFDLLARGTGAATWCCDPDSGELALDRAWQARFAEEEAAGHRRMEDLLALIHEEDRSRVQALFKAHLRGDVPRFECEFRLRSRDGTWVWVDARGEARGEGGRRRVTGTVCDVTERRRREAELRAAREAAAAADRAKGEFLANISHEIRTPMNGIIGMTELLLDSTAEAEHREQLQTVKSSAEALLAVINDILDFAKIEAGKLGLERIEFSPEALLAELAKTLALRAHQQGLELFHVLAPDVPARLRGDPGRLRQVLLNLLGNAIKFTSAGEVELSVRMVGREGCRAAVAFSVRDTGIGIPAERQEEIFAPFSQADASTTRRYGGTGLGLAISRRLAGLMDGALRVESRPGEGSTFTFTVPLEVAVEPAELRPPAGLAGAKVLVLEDSRGLARVICAQLEAWGMRPRSAADGAAALDLLAAAADGRDPFDFALVDGAIAAPGGFAFAERFAEAAPWLDRIVMMLPSHSRRQDAARCQRLGLASRLAKPFSAGELLEALEMAREGVPLARPPELHDFDPEATLAEALGESDRPDGMEVLLVEDNLVNQVVATRMLEAAGHRVTVANNGQEALDLFAPDRFDLILMDVQMPVMGGIEATQAIRAREMRSSWVMGPEEGWRTVPIIAMTAYAMEGDRTALLEAGMDDYVTKPVRPAELFAAIARARARGDDEDSGAGRLTVLESSADNEPADLARTRAMLDGDEDSVQQLLRIFFRDLDGSLAELRKAGEAGNLGRLADLAHAFNGSAGVFFANRVVDAAAEVERLARAGDRTGAERSLVVLLAETRTLASVLRKSLRES